MKSYNHKKHKERIKSEKRRKPFIKQRNKHGILMDTDRPPRYLYRDY